jgi:non-ribosomal peptide synthase protein (TIGR01720 family)
LHLPWDKLIPFPVDYPENRDRNTNGSEQSLSIELEVRETEALFARIRAFHTDIICTLLMGLVEAAKQWPELHILYVDVPDHGRSMFKNLNLLRTVGQIAIGRRYLLRVEQSADLREALRSVATQLSDAPNNAVGYDLFAYYSQDPQITATMQTLPLHDILLNYLGRQSGESRNHTSLFKTAHIPTGATVDPREQRESTLRFTVLVTDNRLSIACQYSEALHKRSTIEQLLQGYKQTLQAFIAL